METRILGASGLQVSALSLGTMTFGGGGEFAKMGDTQADEAQRIVDICLDAGMNLFDTADVYSRGASEEVLGRAVAGRRHRVVLATKAFGPMGDGPNDRGLSRHHLVRALEASLRRLETDYVDLYQVHGYDAITPLEETLGTLDDFVRQGKVRYVGCSNHSGWHLMKALAVSEREGLERYVAHQAYYSLVGRDLEHELVPLALDQGVGTLVWSPLAGGFLSGKYRRGQAGPLDARRAHFDDPPVDPQRGYDVVEAAAVIAEARGVSVAQVALNWLLRKPWVTSVIIGARHEEQLRDNLAAATWALSAEEVARLDEASATPAPYPSWHQRKNARERPPVPDHL